jgi:hypothetical protein
MMIAFFSASAISSGWVIASCARGYALNQPKSGQDWRSWRGHSKIEPIATICVSFGFSRLHWSLDQRNVVG